MAESVEQSGRVYSAVCQRLRVYIAELHSLGRVAEPGQRSARVWAEWQSGRVAEFEGQSVRV